MRSTTLSGLAVLGAGYAAAQNSTTNQTELAAYLERYWSYGRSPPVYPTPEGAGLGDWSSAYSQARDLVSQMTNDEKNNITYGYTSTTNGCSGNSGGVPRLGFPGLCLQDAGNGVRGTDGVSGWASGLSIGASWNKTLALERAQYMGAEFKAKGVNVALGPVVGPLGRIARGGRNWEGFSNDPYLSGALTFETVMGLQESVISCLKHYIGNEQETERNPPLLIPGALNQSASSNIDDKTLHELYLWPFQEAVRAGVGAIMCSYNEINGSYACQNSKTLNGVLKGELAFQGFVVTDWGAQHSGLASAESGLDMVMPDSTYWENGNLTLMVSNGSLAQSRLDDMATRIVATWHMYGNPDNETPGFGMPLSLTAPHELVDARNPDSRNNVLQGAIEGHVLVKNTNNTLPLSKPKFLSLFGYDGIVFSQNTPPAASGYHWAFGLENTYVVPGAGTWNDTQLISAFLSSESADSPVPGASLNGTLISGGGSGATQPPYVDAPYDAFLRKARSDGTLLQWDFYNQNPSVDGATEACIVFVNELASEGWDRPYLADPYSDTLIENVASQCSNTIVVIHNAGVRLVDAWINNPNITAVIYAHVPGPESGEALTQVMYGDVSPSGRLPYTVAKQASDYGSLEGPVLPSPDEIWHTQINFTEGVYIDYKHFIAQNITPRYAFGYGLTYSEFTYSGLKTSTSGSGHGGWHSGPASYSGHHSHGGYGGSSNATSVGTAEGGDPSLWTTVAEVSATVSNTGKVAAAEVAQLYVNIPGGPAKQLRGFEKVYLEAGASATVKFDLTRKDLSEWDVVSQNWVLQGGSYDVYVGKSVEDIQLTGSVSV